MNPTKMEKLPDAAVILSLYVVPAIIGVELVGLKTFCFAAAEIKFAATM